MASPLQVTAINELTMPPQCTWVSQYWNVSILDFIGAKDDGGGGDNWTTGAISRAKLQSNHDHQQTNTQLLTGRMPFLSPNQQSQSTEGKSSYLLLTFGYCLTRLFFYRPFQVREAP